MIGTIYLLHFDTPYKQARHYIGWTSNLKGRMYYHQHSKGARLLAVLNEVGIKYYLTKVWSGSRIDERRLKKRKDAPRICPVCRLLAKSVNHRRVRYFCLACNHNHYLDSQIGKRHYLRMRGESAQSS